MSDELFYEVKNGIILTENDIVEFCVEDNEIVLTKSSGQHPIGIVLGFYPDKLMNVNRADIKYQRHFGQTDNFETDQLYTVNAPLFVSENGKFTTIQEKSINPCVGMVLIPPTVVNPILEFLWY